MVDRSSAVQHLPALSCHLPFEISRSVDLGRRSRARTITGSNATRSRCGEIPKDVRDAERALQPAVCMEMFPCQRYRRKLARRIDRFRNRTAKKRHVACRHADRLADSCPRKSQVGSRATRTSPIWRGWSTSVPLATAASLFGQGAPIEPQCSTRDDSTLPDCNTQEGVDRSNSNTYRTTQN